MGKVYITRKIPDIGLNMLHDKGHEVVVSGKDGVLSRDELIAVLSGDAYDAVLSLLTDEIDGEVFDAVPSAKIFANYAVGFDNIDLDAARDRGITVTNTPDVLTDTVAEYTIALILAVAKRIPEADRFTKELKYHGWEPELFLGSDLAGKTLGVIGCGRIGAEVAKKARHGLGMHIIYYDVRTNERIENDANATYYSDADAVFRDADVVSIHVPLLESTHHFVDARRLALMRPSAYLINTSRGPVVDEGALVAALRNGVIRGAGLDVFEDEPNLAYGLPELANAVITPHIASASVETRNKMSEMAATNIIEFLAGNTPPNVVT